MATMNDENKKYELTGETLLYGGVKLQFFRWMRQTALCAESARNGN